jgi:tellurite resistance-related uncharacterized protein
MVEVVLKFGNIQPNAQWRECEMTELPGDVVAYRRSPEFDERTLPAALQRPHTTKAGAWALINVLEGKLLYRVLDPPFEMILAELRRFEGCEEAK